MFSTVWKWHYFMYSFNFRTKKIAGTKVSLMRSLRSNRNVFKDHLLKAVVWRSFLCRNVTTSCSLISHAMLIFKLFDSFLELKIMLHIHKENRYRQLGDSSRFNLVFKAYCLFTAFQMLPGWTLLLTTVFCLES